MYFKSKKISLIILGITALLVSRAMFAFIDDPEGPNLLVVTVVALVIYFPSLMVYKFNFPITRLKRLSLAIFVQILIVTGLYFLAMFV